MIAQLLRIALRQRFVSVLLGAALIAAGAYAVALNRRSWPLWLLAFALTNYPRVLPQITRMTTGRSPHDPEFVEAWQAFLRDVGARLR